MAQDFAETLATVQFEKAVEHQLLEVKDSFEAMCDFKGGTVGEKVEITDRFSTVKAKRMEGRLQKITHTTPDVERRWIHKQLSVSIHIPIDMDDQLATEIQMDSPIAVAVARAIKVARQDEFLIGFYGTSYTGKEGTTQVSFLNGNVIAADWNGTTNDATMRGLTLAKLRRVRTLARKLMIDPSIEKLHMGITAEEIDDLLQINEYISRDYNPDSQMGQNRIPMSKQAEQALQDGEPTDFLGIHFVPMEFTNAEAYPESSVLSLNGSGHRRCPVWVPSGMSGREWKAIDTKRSERTDIDGHPIQYSAYTNVRYSRRDEKKCFIVECAN